MSAVKMVFSAMLGLVAAAVPSAVGTAAASVRGLPPSDHHLMGGRQAGSTQVARRQASALAGYLWSGGTNSYYAFNESGGAVTVTHTGTGTYAVVFHGLAATKTPSATADITTYGFQATCNISVLATTVRNWYAAVDCYSSGLSQDAVFDLVLTRPVRAVDGVIDYAYVDRPSGKLTSPFDYNSVHRTNSVRHLGPGRYEVIMPGPKSSGTTGTVKVTPSADRTQCQIVGWHGTRTGQVIDVDCFYDATGAPSDATFMVTYASRNNLMGLNGVTSASAFANRPTAPRYQPSVQYGSHRGAKVTVVRVGQGKYKIIFAGSGGPWRVNGGDVQVSAVGSTDRHCIIDSWAQGLRPNASVSCTDISGNAIDSRFTIQWVVA